MPSVSKKQQNFFRLVKAVQSGDVKKGDVDQRVRDVAKEMTRKQVKDFADHRIKNKRKRGMKIQRTDEFINQSTTSHRIVESRNMVNEFIEGFKLKVISLFKKYNLDGYFKADWDRLTAFMDDNKLEAGKPIRLGGYLEFPGDYVNHERINKEIERLSFELSGTKLHFFRFNIPVTYNWAVSHFDESYYYRILLKGNYDKPVFDLTINNMDEILSKIEELIKAVDKYK